MLQSCGCLYLEGPGDVRGLVHEDDRTSVMCGNHLVKAKIEEVEAACVKEMRFVVCVRGGLEQAVCPSKLDGVLGEGGGGCGLTSRCRCAVGGLFRGSRLCGCGHVFGGLPG